MTDPVFAAIEADRQAWANLNAVERADEDGPIWKRADDAVQAADDALDKTIPTTREGLLAYVDYWCEQHGAEGEPGARNYGVPVDVLINTVEAALRLAAGTWGAPKP